MKSESFKLIFPDLVQEILQALQSDKSQKIAAKAVLKSLKLMATNLRHPGLRTHKNNEYLDNGAEVFQSYAQNNTPGAYRIFWVYGPETNEITILDITSHP